MCIFQKHEVTFEDGMVPPLQEEWLPPDEIDAARRKKRVELLKQERRTWQESKSQEA